MFIIKMNQQLNTSVDNKYLKVREKAYNLENEIESGEKEYKEHILQIIHKIQSEYYKKYGTKIDELQDLLDAIEQYQNKGYLDFLLGKIIQIWCQINPL